MNETATRILKWFVEQDQAVQAAVIARVPAGLEDSYAFVLDKIAQRLRDQAKRRGGGDGDKR